MAAFIRGIKKGKATGTNADMKHSTGRRLCTVVTANESSGW